MKYFHYCKNKKKYFEGWFFKASGEDLSFSAIAGISIVKQEKFAFVQVNYKKSYYQKFDFNDFSAEKDKLFIKIKDNIFSEKGIVLKLEDIEINVKFGGFEKLKGDIMGPFKCGLPCCHKIISMAHDVRGFIRNNDETVSFTNANGYAEMDYGKSFPVKYAWIQCNNFNNITASLFFSAAKLKLIFNFTGLICVLKINGKDHKFATYNFAKIKRLSENEIILKKGKKTLTIKYKSNGGNALFAPKNGGMADIIKEDLSAGISVTFINGREKIMLEGKNAGVETV